MKNFEIYEDEVRKFKDGNFCRDFVIPHILKKDNCAYLSCSDCGRRQMLWFVEEYEEPETDWSQVEVDTPILVKNREDDMWRERHFAKYKNGNIYAWSDGQTSWTAYDMMVWRYAKLAEDAKEDKESEVDWNEVKIDTLIMVKASENGDWFKRYFAEYKNGKIYTWDNGHTSWETSRMIEWKYAKLVEDEEECKESEVDWSKVEVDTPILVRDVKYRRWVKRYFAKYKEGIVFAWTGGSTSEDAHNIRTPWKYAKLAESEE